MVLVQDAEEQLCHCGCPDGRDPVDLGEGLLVCAPQWCQYGIDCYYDGSGFVAME